MKNGLPHNFYLAFGYLALWIATAALCMVPVLAIAYVHAITTGGNMGEWPWWTLPCLAACGCMALFTRKGAALNLRYLQSPDDPGA